MSEGGKQETARSRRWWEVLKTKSPLVPKSGPVCLSPSITFALALLSPCHIVRTPRLSSNSVNTLLDHRVSVCKLIICPDNSDDSLWYSKHLRPSRRPSDPYSVADLCASGVRILRWVDSLNYEVSTPFHFVRDIKS